MTYTYHTYIFQYLQDCGTKDALPLKVAMLRGGRKYLALYKELEAICNLDSEKIHNIRPKTFPSSSSENIDLKS